MRALACLLALSLAGCSALLGIDEPSATGNVDGDGLDVPDATVGPDAATHRELVLFSGGSGSGSIVSDPPGIDCPATACTAIFPIGTQVTLTATEQNGIFTGFIGGGCTGNGLVCDVTLDASLFITGRFFLSSVNHMFVTSDVRNPGSFDGIAAADAFCQSLADAAGLPGDYQVWLPTTAVPTKDRFSHVSGWVRVDGEPFLFDVDDLASSGRIFYPPRLSELGFPVGDSEPVVTDTLPDGTAAAGDHCQDWASELSGSVLVTGEPAGGTGRWTAAGQGHACNAPAHYYCLQTNFPAAVLSELPTDQAVAFVSQMTMLPNEGVARADQICGMESMMLGLALPSTTALIANGGPVAERFEGLFFFDKPVLRPDGVQVAESVEALLAAGVGHEAPINVTAARTYVDEVAWVGGPDFGIAGASCGNWTQQMAGAFGLVRPVASAAAGAVARTEECMLAHRVLCLSYLAAQAKPALAP